MASSVFDNENFDVVIVGAGPAGSSLAIRLAKTGRRVALIERDNFPRPKLCGEFISPECFRHFEELGTLPDMLELGGDKIRETRFFSTRGRSIAVPTKWFGSGDFALSLSRGAMDHQLAKIAQCAGVAVTEGVRATGVSMNGETIESVTVTEANGEKSVIRGKLFVDASGRSAALSRLIDKRSGNAPVYRPRKPGLVAFKSHIVGAGFDPGVCEMYSFGGGYGGLSHVENGMANFCSIVRSHVARAIVGKTDLLMAHVRSGNARARVTLGNAVPAGDWLAVPITEFGRKRTPAARNLFAIGDAGAFIDPFTGSGMLMAFESSELLARHIAATPAGTVPARESHERIEREHFKRRLMMSSFLRRTAFSPGLASAAVFGVGLSSGFRRWVARTTRAGSRTANEGR